MLGTKWEKRAEMAAVIIHVKKGKLNHTMAQSKPDEGRKKQKKIKNLARIRRKKEKKQMKVKTTMSNILQTNSNDLKPKAVSKGKVRGGEHWLGKTDPLSVH